MMQLIESSTEKISECLHLFEKIMFNKKLAASKAYSIPPTICRSKLCKIVKNYFFSIKLLHAHLQYVCNISTMHYNISVF